MVASYCCRGGSDFGAVIAAGIDSGIEGTGLTLVEVGTHPEDRELLAEFAAAGTGLILTDGTAMPIASELLDENPDLIVGNFECTGAILDTHSRMWCVQPSNHEIGFLAGAAAGLVTETDRVGIILGVDTWNMFPFMAGFEQGVAYTNPDASVDSVFLNSVLPYEDFSGFESPALGQLAAMRMFEEGSDVIFAAAGYSNMGIHQTAYEYTMRRGSKSGRLAPIVMPGGCSTRIGGPNSLATTMAGLSAKASRVVCSRRFSRTVTSGSSC